MSNTGQSSTTTTPTCLRLVPSLLSDRPTSAQPRCYESREPCVTQHRALCDHCALCMCIVVHCAPRPSSQAHQRVYQYSLFQETSVLDTALLSVSTAWITESGIVALGGIYRSFMTSGYAGSDPIPGHEGAVKVAGPRQVSLEANPLIAQQCSTKVVSGDSGARIVTCHPFTPSDQRQSRMHGCLFGRFCRFSEQRILREARGQGGKAQRH